MWWWQKQGVLGICLATFTLLSYVLYYVAPAPASHFDRDSYIYERIACHVCAYGQAIDPADPTNAPVQTVVYPWLVGLWYRCTIPCVQSLVLIQVLITLLSIIGIYVIAVSLFDKRVGVVAACLSVVNVGLLVYAQLVLAETLLTCVLVWFLERFIVWGRIGRTSILLQSGLLLSCSIIIKPMALVYPLILVPLIMYQAQSTTHALKSTGYFLASSYVCVGVYMLRNFFLYGFFALAPMLNLNIYQCFLSKVLAQMQEQDADKIACATLTCTSTQLLDDHGWDQARKLFFATVREHALLCCAVWLRNVLKSMGGLFCTQLKSLLHPQGCASHASFFALSSSLLHRLCTYIMEGADSWYLCVLCWMEAVWSVIRLFFISSALLRLWCKRLFALLWLLVSYCGYLAFVTGMDGCCRYRLAWEPVLIVLTAAGIAWCREYGNKGKKGGDYVVA